MAYGPGRLLILRCPQFGLRVRLVPYHNSVALKLAQMHLKSAERQGQASVNITDYLISLIRHVGPLQVMPTAALILSLRARAVCLSVCPPLISLCFITKSLFIAKANSLFFVRAFSRVPVASCQVPPASWQLLKCLSKRVSGLKKHTQYQNWACCCLV